MSPKLSVVVPFYNVEPYVEACLESIARQTLRDIEVVLVDDGSLDGSAVIAKAYAEADPRFHLVRQDNQGLGPARNTGAALATGEYLTFADSDDVVSRSAYELLAGSLDETGSDIAAGNVMRFDASRVWQAWAHDEPFRTTRKRTHVTAQTSLMQDRMVWNKVFRRSFWDGQGLSFPDMLYEDSPVMVRAHVLASAVDVLSPHVYYWRQRDSGEPSITQRKAELSNLEDRMESVRQVHNFLHAHAPRLKPVYDGYALGVDLRVLVASLLTATDAERDRIVELGQEFLAVVDRQVVGGLPAAHRLCYHLLGHGRLPELLELLRFERAERPNLAVTSRGLTRRRFYARYPFFGDGSVPKDVYEVTGELELVAGVDDVVWDGHRLRVDGHAYVERLAMTPRTRLEVWLEHTTSGRRVGLPVVRVRRPDVTADSGQAVVSYDDSGFSVEVAPERLKIDHAWRAADWRLHVAVKGRGYRRTGTVRRQAHGRASWPPMADVADGVRMQVVREGSDPVVIRLKRPAAFVTGLRVDGDTAEITGRVGGRPADCAVHITRRRGVAAVYVPAEVRPLASGGSEFTARVPLAELAAEPDLVDRVVNVAQVGEGIQWDVAVRVRGRTRKLAMTESAGSVRYVLSGASEVTLTTTRFGNLAVVERSSRPVVDHVEWTPDGRLVLKGTAAERPRALILRHRRASEEYRFAMVWNQGRFTAEVAPGGVARLGGETPLPCGDWAFFVNTPNGDVPVVVDRTCLALLGRPVAVGVHEMRLTGYQTDALQLRIRTALRDDERGPYAQRVIQERDYPAYRRNPLRDLVVFDCYEGLQYSCNPRAIYEELLRRETDFESVWVSKDGRFTVPGGARTVLAGSRDHYRALAEARFVVGNYGQFPWFVKREGQTYVQTWHGTPLKKLAYDLRDMPYKRTETLDWMEREVPRWDVLVSPNPFTTPIMRRAFRYDGEILETGYPRNDVLHATGRDRIGEEVRARLGIPPGRTVVLYAPTWRDDHHIAHGKRGFSLRLDLNLAREALGEDHVFLVRTHYLISDRTWSEVDDVVIDVSSYPDIADLYLVADVLVTDYSSAMFDFAGTGRPMIFFAYDLERYRDHVRGFYFDFTAEAPGPLLRTSAEVVGALRELGAVRERYADAYEAFTAKFCPYDDGGASARVVDRIIGR